MPHPEAPLLAAEVVARDPHVNVCAAAVDGLAEVGDGGAIPALEALAERFPGGGLHPASPSRPPSAGFGGQRCRQPAPTGRQRLVIAITEEEFAKFYEFFYRRTGISFAGKKEYFVEKRLHASGWRRRNATSFKSYFTMIRFQASGEELQHLVNS